MDTATGLIIVGAIVVFVILINLLIYYRFSKPGPGGRSRGMGPKIPKLRSSPWDDEDKKLNELNSLVSNLKNEKQDNSHE